jgi:hypothetical protein
MSIYYLKNLSSAVAPAAENISGGIANQIPFQSAASTTAFSNNLTFDASQGILKIFGPSDQAIPGSVMLGNVTYGEARITTGGSNNLSLRIQPHAQEVGNGIRTGGVVISGGDVAGSNGALAGGVDIIGGGTNSTAAGGLYGPNGPVTITGGPGSGASSSGGSVTISGGTGNYSAGSVVLRGGTGNSGGGIISLYTAETTTLVQRLSILANGAWSIGSDNTSYGTSGQVLTSNGAAPPTWQPVGVTGTVTSVDASGGTTGLTFNGGPITSSGTLTLNGTLGIANGGTGQTTAGAAINALLPSQVSQSGKYLTTDGTTVSWSSVTAAQILPSSVTVGTSDSAASITGNTSTSGSGSPMTVAAGATSAGNGNSLTLAGGAAASANTGGAVVIRSGDSGAGGGGAGPVTVHADSSYGGGAVTVRGGDSSGNGSIGAVAGGGSLTLRGGDSSNASTGSIPGSVTIRGGNSIATTAGGSVTISGGTGPAGGGQLLFQTASTTSPTERLRITNGGAWGLGGANYGTSGQVLTSNGSGAPPTWTTVASESLPTQTGNSGKYLTTDGSSASWSAITSLNSTVAFSAGYNESVSAVTSSTSTNIDCSLGNNFDITLSSSITTLTFSNVPTTRRLFPCTLILIQDSVGGRTISWPASFKWSGKVAPTLTSTAGGIDIITMITYDGGTTWLATVAGQNF